MGFMDKLKEIGLGNTGPRGNMNSGATNYANYAKERQSFESERGVAQGLALASKGGKLISYDKFVDIAEKWGVPVEKVAERGRAINDGLDSQMLKDQVHGMMTRYYDRKKKEPNWEPSEADIKKDGIEFQIDPRAHAIVKDYIVQKQEKPVDFTLAEGGKRFRSLGGKTTEIASNPKQPEKDNPNEIELIRRAEGGDPAAKQLLDAMMKRKEESGTAAAVGKLKGLFKEIGVEGVSRAVVEGRETVENVRNTFGVPIQEVIRKRVLEIDPNFNFVVPRAVVKSLSSSLANQEKQRGMMGSFVRNINSQVGRVEEIMNDVDRWGFRALDLPRRELKKKFVGSGKEITLDGYLTEISNEINKLSQGSQASIAQLGEESQKRWNAIHDPALSLREIKIILDETKQMAEMRIASTNEELDFTRNRLKNLKEGGSSSLQRSTPQQEQPPSKFEILEVKED